MTSLRIKIASAHKIRQDHLTTRPNKTDIQVLRLQNQSEPVLRRLLKWNTPAHLPSTSTTHKDILKNYYRMFTNFASSPLALPYLEPLLQNNQLQLDKFLQFITLQKGTVSEIRNVRSLLINVTETDSQELIAIKIMFHQINVIFLKLFCLDWVFNSKIVDKVAHLSYRLKLLRRIKNQLLRRGEEVPL
jgi:hypothetical protein